MFAGGALVKHRLPGQTTDPPRFLGVPEKVVDLFSKIRAISHW